MSMRIKVRTWLFLLFGLQGVLQVVYWELIKGYPACFMCKGYRVLYASILVAAILYRYRESFLRLLFLCGLIITEAGWSVWEVIQKLGFSSQKCQATAHIVKGNIMFTQCSSNTSSLLKVLGTPVGVNAMLSVVMLGFVMHVLWQLKFWRFNLWRFMRFRWSLVMIGLWTNESVASSHKDVHKVIQQAAKAQESKSYASDAQDLCDASEVEAKKYEAQARKIGVSPSQEALAEAKKIIHGQDASNANKASCKGKCPSFNPTPNVEPSLQVCMSFSVPTQVWKDLNEDLIRHQGVFVVRGLPNNSFQAFAQKVLEFRKHGITAPIRMDPKLFERLKVHQVPLFVVKKQDETHTVSGTVTIPYVIELMHIKTGETQ